MQILKVPRQLCSIAHSSIFVGCFSLQPYPLRLSNLGEELVYLDEKKAGWKDDCLFIFGTLEKRKRKKEKKENVGLDQPTTNRFTISSLAKGGSGANIILILSHFFLFLILFSKVKSLLQK